MLCLAEPPISSPKSIKFKIIFLRKTRKVKKKMQKEVPRVKNKLENCLNLSEMITWKEWFIIFSESAEHFLFYVT